MEVKLPPGALNVRDLRDLRDSVTNASRNVEVEPPKKDKRDEPEQKDIQREIVRQTADLLSIGDRKLKFEMLKDEGIYQLHVIDTTDGRVVRKIPPDELLKMIAHLKEQANDRVDVLA